MALRLIELIKFYDDKKEHYPISDEFIKNYQQKDGPYIDHAGKTGHTVSAEQCEPDQKWHLFVAYIPDRLKRNGGDAEARVGTLKCPELLLWMAEAAGIDDEIVTEAKEAAASEIDRIRKKDPNSPYSKAASKKMNEEIYEKYGKSMNLQDMIVKQVKDALKAAARA